MDKINYSKDQIEAGKLLRNLVLLYIYLFIYALINCLLPHFEFKGLNIFKYYAEYGFLLLALFSYTLTLTSSIKIKVKDNKILLLNIIFVPIYIIYSLIYNYFYHINNGDYINSLVFIEGIIFLVIQIIIIKKVKNKYGNEITKIKDNVFVEDYLIGINKSINLPSDKFKLVNGFLIAFLIFDLLPPTSIISFIFYSKLENVSTIALIISIIFSSIIELTLLFIFIILNKKYKVYNFKLSIFIILKELFIYFSLILNASILSNSIEYNEDPKLIAILIFLSFLSYLTFSIFINITYPYYRFFIIDKYKELKNKEELNNLESK